VEAAAEEKIEVTDVTVLIGLAPLAVGTTCRRGAERRRYERSEREARIKIP